MSWLDIPRVDEPEEIDDSTQPFAELERSMRDVALTNRLFGGTQTMLHHVARLLQDVPAGTSIRILDIATGSADIPRALQVWGQKRGLNLTIVAVDNHAGMLQLARKMAADIHLVQADALALPFPPCSFDLALCALAFHHLGFDASARLLTAMDALTTRGFVVSDLRRDLPTLWGVQATMAAPEAPTPSPAMTALPAFRRAFTPPEYRKMVGLAGVHHVRLYCTLVFPNCISPGQEWVEQK